MHVESYRCALILPPVTLCTVPLFEETTLNSLIFPLLDICFMQLLTFMNQSVMNDLIDRSILFSFSFRYDVIIYRHFLKLRNYYLFFF